MEKQVQAIIDDLEARRWDPPPPNERAIELAINYPEAFVELAQQAIKKDDASGHVIAEALSFVPQDYWPPIVQDAVQHLESGENAVARDVISSATIQFPSLLDEFRQRIPFNEVRRPLPSCAWRRATESDIAFLKKLVDSQKSTALVRFHALEALMATRRPEVINWCIENDKVDLSASLRAIKIPDEMINESARQSAIWYLRKYDYEEVNGKLRNLTSDRTMHMVFPPQYLVDRPMIHPSWKIQGEVIGTEHQFGGVAEVRCDHCGDQLCGLLRLNPIPEGIGVSGLSTLHIISCLRCLGWVKGYLYYQHWSDGSFVQVDDNIPAHAVAKDCFDQPPFVSTTIQLTQTIDRWSVQDWGESNGKQNLFRVGGTPCWIQQPDYPFCPKCGTTMCYLMEFDSDIPTIDDRAFLWGSGGIGYFYWCDACKVSAGTWQCT